MQNVENTNGNGTFILEHPIQNDIYVFKKSVIVSEVYIKPNKFVHPIYGGAASQTKNWVCFVCYFKMINIFLEK